MFENNPDTHLVSIAGLYTLQESFARTRRGLAWLNAANALIRSCPQGAVSHLNQFADPSLLRAVRFLIRLELVTVIPRKTFTRPKPKESARVPDNPMYRTLCQTVRRRIHLNWQALRGNVRCNDGEGEQKPPRGNQIRQPVAHS